MITRRGKRAVALLVPALFAVLAALVLARGGGATDGVVGYDGEPVVCPDGEPLRVPLAEPAPEPSPTEVMDAQEGLPGGKKAVFNEYTGEFETVDAVTAAGTLGEVSYSEPLYYACGPSDEPVLKPLSEIDPAAAAEARAQMKRQIADFSGLTGLGGDPADPSR